MLSGLFDKAAEPQFVEKEIVRCIGMAKDGIHAVLVVVSLRSRISIEEATAIETLQKFFGNKISDYMILVFTGGDQLEEDDVTLDDYLSHSESVKVGISDLIISMNFNPIKGTAQITICLSSNIHSSTINWTLMDCHHYSEGSFSG